jgi:hypothetical protein
MMDDKRPQDERSGTPFDAPSGDTQDDTGYAGETQDGAEAAPDQATWDESSYRFAEQIERGEWPIQVPFAIELGFEGGRPRMRVKRDVSEDDLGTPERPLLHVQVRMDQSKMLEIARESIADAEKRGLSKLVGFTVLARIDREYFLETAAEYFSRSLTGGDDALRNDTTLPGFIVDLHERGKEVIVTLVERTIAVNRTAGERLREVIVDAVNEPPCRDELGMLAAAELVERLESL